MKGAAIHRGTEVLVQGRVWGEDFLLENPKHRFSGAALALTFLEVLRLDVAPFEELLQCHPRERAHVRRGRVKLIVIRGLLLFAHDKAASEARSLGEPRVRSSQGSMPKFRRKSQVLDNLRFTSSPGEPTGPRCRARNRRGSWGPG